MIDYPFAIILGIIALAFYLVIAILKKGQQKEDCSYFYFYLLPNCCSNDYNIPYTITR